MASFDIGKVQLFSFNNNDNLGDIVSKVGRE